MSKEQWIKENLKPSEVYAGILLGDVDQHIILLPRKIWNVTWEEAKRFAASSGGELPTRREQSLLFANAHDEFKPVWHWSSEQYSDDTSCAWVQDFGNGYQYCLHKSGEYATRPVRRIPV